MRNSRSPIGAEVSFSSTHLNQMSPVMWDKDLYSIHPQTPIPYTSTMLSLDVNVDENLIIYALAHWLETYEIGVYSIFYAI